LHIKYYFFFSIHQENTMKYQSWLNFKLKLGVLVF
jgi:hypothetical protein